MPHHHHPESSMEHLLGLLRLIVHKGVNLAVRDVVSSDPYVVVRMGHQKLKTRVVNKSLNPEWNEELTLSISEPLQPIKMMVYDKDLFSMDDKMGDAEFNLGPFLESLKLRLDQVPSGTIVRKVQPNRDNCLSEESHIVWKDGKIVQTMMLRLRNVERGEIEIEIQWINIPGSKGILMGTR